MGKFNKPTTIKWTFDSIETDEFHRHSSPLDFSNYLLGYCSRCYDSCLLTKWKLELFKRLFLLILLLRILKLSGYFTRGLPLKKTYIVFLTEEGFAQLSFLSCGQSLSRLKIAFCYFLINCFNTDKASSI